MNPKENIDRESISRSGDSCLKFHSLSVKRKFLKLIAGGLSNQEVADKMFTSLRTVETHRFNLTENLDVKMQLDL